MMNEDGAVLSSGVGGIMWNHPDTGRSGWLIREIGGNPVNGINEMKSDCLDTTLLGSFMENHDNPRFPSLTSDLSLAKNAIAFTILQDGIPISKSRIKFYRCFLDANYAKSTMARSSITLAGLFHTIARPSGSPTTTPVHLFTASSPP